LIFFAKKAKPRERVAHGASVNHLARFFATPFIGSPGATEIRTRENGAILREWAQAVDIKEQSVFQLGVRVPADFERAGLLLLLCRRREEKGAPGDIAEQIRSST
jgi:hypothetical protein